LQVEIAGQARNDKQEHIGAIHESPASSKMHPSQVQTAGQARNDDSETIKAIISNSVDAGLAMPTTAEIPTPASAYNEQRILSRLEKLEAALREIGNLLENPHHGLLHYQKWWFRSAVDVSINGEKLSGTPIFVHDDTIRMVNDDHSYFVPLTKIDYIRTTDGLKQGYK